MLGVLLAYIVIHGEAPLGTGQRFGPPEPEPAQTNNVEAVKASEPSRASKRQGVPDDRGSSTARMDINEVDHRVPVDAPLRGDPEARVRVTYDTVIDQFAVEKNPRYKPREDITPSYDPDK